MPNCKTCYIGVVVGIMEKKMQATVLCRGYIGVI